MLSSSCCKKLSLLAALPLLCALSQAAQAAAQAADWHADVPQAHQIGQGEFTWFGLGIYTATLWSAAKTQDMNTPFALQLTYHRHIGAQRFVDSSIAEMRRLGERHGSPVSADQLTKWEGYLSRIFPDVSDGDQLVGVFIPGKGCRFYDRNRQLGQVDDPEFARAFFAIWLDPDTRDTDLRNHLLGPAQ